MVTTNAVLTQITAAGAVDDYGDPTPGAVLWTGRAPGYLKRQRSTRLGPGGQQVDARSDTFTILDTAGAAVLEAAGADWEATSVVIEDQRTTPSVTRTFTVRGMEHRAAGTILDSVRLELDHETAS